MDTHLLETIEDGIATVTINRPDVRNALSHALIQRLKDSIQRLALNSTVRVVVLTGGRDAFCAGGDIGDMHSGVQFGIDPARFDADVEAVRIGMEASRWLHEMPKPTLAIIGGAAAGAGLALALACDLRIAADEAKFTTAFSKIGVSGDFGASYFLTQLVGAAKARELMFLSEVFTSAEAMRMGLINYSVPRDQLAREGRNLAQRLGKLPTFAIGCMKANLKQAARSSLSETLDIEAENLIRCFGKADSTAAIARFMMKT